MSVNLSKGGNISLVKAAEDAGVTLDRLVVAAGWDVNKKKGGLFNREKDYDLDVSAAGLDASGKVPDRDDPTDRGWQQWFIWANHRHPGNKSVQFMGDNRTGAGEGDDELIEVTLSNVADDIQKIKFGVVIWRAEERGQKFGNVQNAFIRIYDKQTRTELARYDLGSEFSDETFVVFGELYRHNGEWKFRAIGQGYNAAAYRQEHNIKKKFETDYARYND
jgi:tellurium resistance protein TerD